METNSSSHVLNFEVCKVTIDDIHLGIFASNPYVRITLIYIVFYQFIWKLYILYCSSRIINIEHSCTKWIEITVDHWKFICYNTINCYGGTGCDIESFHIEEISWYDSYRIKQSNTIDDVCPLIDVNWWLSLCLEKACCITFHVGHIRIRDG